MGFQTRCYHFGFFSTALNYYKDKLADVDDTLVGIERLISIYKKDVITPSWVKELCSGVKETRMTQKQLKDAVDKLIRTNPYSNIKVADVLSHKKHLKLYTYHERCVYITEKIRLC